MLKEHQLKQIRKRDEIDHKRNAAILSSVQFTSKVVNHLNDGVAQTYLNQRKLDSEAKQLVTNIEQFSRSINQWVGLMNGFNDALKQLGDVENWARVIETDMREISSILEYVHKQNSQEAPLASQPPPSSSS